MTSGKEDFDNRYGILNSVTPRHTQMMGQYKMSFAYYTLRERLPVTLTGIINRITKDKDEIIAKYGEEAREDIKEIAGRLSQLKYQLQTDKLLQKFTGNEPDKEIWNTFLAGLNRPTFFKTTWLYVECFMYRKVFSFFEASKVLQTYDYFEKDKVNSMEISVPVVENLLRQFFKMPKDRNTFAKIVKLTLWGNRCDLSMTCGKEVKPLSNPLNALDSLDKFILINHTTNVWECLANADKSKPIIVDIINDNSGFELFTDLMLATYIIDKGLATKVRFNVKALPWFISDVTPADFEWTVNFFKDHNLQPLREFGQRIAKYLQNGQFELMPISHFWTSPYECYRMPDIDVQLYNQLSEAALLIFKGDLNYRKLLGDIAWDYTESLETCLKGFHPTNLVTLRTVKADLICGLKEGQAEELFNTNKNWMLTGEYGVIHYSGSSQSPAKE